MNWYIILNLIWKDLLLKQTRNSVQERYKETQIGANTIFHDLSIKFIAEPDKNVVKKETDRINLHFTGPYLFLFV